MIWHGQVNLEFKSTKSTLANLTAEPTAETSSFVFPMVAITSTFQFFSETVIVFITLVIYSCLMYFSYSKWKKNTSAHSKNEQTYLCCC